MIDPFLEAERLIIGTQFIGEVGYQFLDVAGSQHCRGRAHQHRGRSETFQFQPELCQFRCTRFKPVAGIFVQFNHFCHQQGL